MAYENYFPRGIAKQKAFCNRVKERKRLINNIQTGQHTLLISPRRYGKTSLATYSIKETGYPYADADLFVAIDAEHIERRILACIKEAMKKICNSAEQILHLLTGYFKKLESRWTIGTQGMNLVLSPNDDGADPATTIMESLLALEYLLEKKKKRAVIFLDEVQEIGKLASGRGIEGAIRHVAQQTSYISFIFSGSNRHLLQHMFYDSARPLYKLCDRITLERISERDYREHIDKLSQKRWGKKISNKSFDALFLLTERHPYYLNNLCLRLWDSDIKTPPTPKQIESTWHELSNEEQLDVSRELSSLSNGQKKLLIAISTGQKDKLTSKDFLKKIDMTGASIVEALKVLTKKDYIEKQEDGYYLIDPLIKTVLNKHYH